MRTGIGFDVHRLVPGRRWGSIVGWQGACSGAPSSSIGSGGNRRAACQAVAVRSARNVWSCLPFAGSLPVRSGA